MHGTRIPKDSLVLSEKTEATVFEEAYPLGNGRLGAMVHGGTLQERLSLNHDELWTGYPRRDRFRGDKKAALDRAKEMVRAGKYAEAQEELGRHFGSYGSDAYLPMGMLTVDYSYGNAQISDYERRLELSSALAVTSFKVGEAMHRRTAYVSHPHNLLVYHHTCKNGSFDAHITMQSQLYSRTYVTVENGRPLLLLEGECPVTSAQCMGNTDRTALYTDDPAARGIRFLGILELHTDGQLQHRGNTLSVKGASFMELRLAVETSFNGYEKHPFLEGKPYKQLCFDRLAALRDLPESELRAAHVKDHRKYFNRVAFSLGTDGKSTVPTSQRLARYAAGGADRALPALLFHFGRYITIASSRKGTQATNLQGIWNEQFFPPWHSNYTVNINTEMNYSPTLVIGLPEMYEPLLRLIKEVSEAGRLTAREMYGAGGWVCHHNTDLWRHTQPVAGVATYSFWNAAGAWLCHHLAEYYDYTLDRKFLEKTAFPILLSAAEFYLSQLEDAEDGTRIVFPSTSPENKFRCEGGSSAVAETTEMTMATVRELFRNIDRFAALLQVENDLTRRVARELPRLRPTAVGNDGRVLEWYGEKTEAEPHHRHLSHLYDLHPGHAITPTKTPELAKACERSLEARGGEGTGWSLAWKCNCYAKLGQGGRALELVRMQLRPTKERNVNYHGGGGSYSNLLCAHPPFQIDGNFGITAGIAEMLLQSAPDEVHVLPALPAEWQNVSVRGLSAMGRRKVNFRVKNGKLTDCEIIGTPPAKIYVGGEDLTARFILRDEKSVLQN